MNHFSSEFSLEGELLWPEGGTLYTHTHPPNLLPYRFPSMKCESLCRQPIWNPTYILKNTFSHLVQCKRQNQCAEQAAELSSPTTSAGVPRTRFGGQTQTHTCERSNSVPMKHYYCSSEKLCCLRIFRCGQVGVLLWSEVWNFKHKLQEDVY